MHALSTSRGHAIMIDIVTLDQPLFYAALADATPDNANRMRRKRNVIAHFRRNSYAIGLRMQQAGVALNEKHGLPISEYSPHGGSFPLPVASPTGVISSITTSGLPQRANHEFVVEALCAELGQDCAVLPSQGAERCNCPNTHGSRL